MHDPHFTLTVGDRQPVLQATLLDNDENAVDLTGATVQFSMASDNQTIEGLGGDASVVGDPTLGIVQYVWQVNDTAVAGDYRAEWIVTFSDGRQMTFPNDHPMRIKIRNRI